MENILELRLREKVFLLTLRIKYTILRLMKMKNVLLR